jgi:hypothetical protein
MQMKKIFFVRTRQEFTGQKTERVMLQATVYLSRIEQPYANEDALLILLENKLRL